MLYSEFINNTGCKDTEYNYTVYKNLEALYMTNDALTKETVYNVGKMLVDNSETEAEREAKKAIQAEINLYTEWIDENKRSIDHLNGLIERDTEYINAGIGGEFEKNNIKYWKMEIKRYKNDIKAYRNKIALYKRFFAQ